MESWTVLIEVLVLLMAALLFGTLAERYRQSAIVGYLVAGAIVGPHALRLVRSPERVEIIAQLGIGLLLFTIGLEFSFRRLRRLGRVGLTGGVLQVFVTMMVVAAITTLLGLTPRAAIVIGAMVALSSTASVLRLLTERIELESPYGRHSLGILLLQDMAVVPLALLVSALSGGKNIGDMLWIVTRTIIAGVAMLLAFRILFNVIAPRLLNIRQWAANREFPILLAIIMAIGSAVVAEELNISPSIGAFFAGVLLAESPFAVQIRADVASLRTVFVTLFFASVGMLANPQWVLFHAHIVAAVVVGILIIKIAIVWLVMRCLAVSAGISLATGLCLAQIGEFSFVLAQIARGSLIGEQLLPLVASSSVITLVVTPYLVQLAGPAARWLEARRLTASAGELATQDHALTADQQAPHDRIIIVGFGPAGQRVAEALMEQHRDEIVVIDLNPRSIAVAERYGLRTRVGNAGQPEILQSVGVLYATVVVITIPDPTSSRQVINLCRSMNAEARLLVRARYHAERWELQMTGAWVVVDEEELVGIRLAAETRRTLAQLAPGES
ncbi:MAG TPA: cation:proton antiporter [Tepidisphaeraceae bacterium]|nr:cation:proton antiporter [Tepidisphaeraceae bacterium]